LSKLIASFIDDIIPPILKEPQAAPIEPIDR